MAAIIVMRDEKAFLQVRGYISHNTKNHFLLTLIFESTQTLENIIIHKKTHRMNPEIVFLSGLEVRMNRFCLTSVIINLSYHTTTGFLKIS